MDKCFVKFIIALNILSFYTLFVLIKKPSVDLVYVDMFNHYLCSIPFHILYLSFWLLFIVSLVANRYSACLCVCFLVVSASVDLPSHPSKMERLEMRMNRIRSGRYFEHGVHLFD